MRSLSQPPNFAESVAVSSCIQTDTATSSRREARQVLLVLPWSLLMALPSLWVDKGANLPASGAADLKPHLSWFSPKTCRSARHFQ